MSTHSRGNDLQATGSGAARAGARPTLGVIIRFKNNMRTLPRVIEVIRRQTVQPDLIVGMDNESTDGSLDFMKSIGAQIVAWHKPYNPADVLNAGMEACKTDLVLVISAHMLMLSDDVLQRLVEALQDEQVVCASYRQNFYYSDCVDWKEVQARGLLIGSIYSNSLGVLRRKCWEEVPFNARVTSNKSYGAEDYWWVLEMLRRGWKCRRLEVPFRTERQGPERLLAFTRDAFILGKYFGLPVYWSGIKGTVRQTAGGIFKTIFSFGRDKEARKMLRLTGLEVWGALTWRWHDRLNR